MSPSDEPAGRRRLAGARRVAVTVGVLVAAFVSGPVVEGLDPGLGTVAYVIAVVAVGLAVGVGVVGPAVPRREPSVVPAAARGAIRLAELEALESLLADSARHASHLHHRLRPRLRVLAADALRSRHVDLDDPAGPAPALLGSVAWRWLGPAATPPVHRHGAGPGDDEVAAVVAAVVALQRPPS